MDAREEEEVKTASEARMRRLTARVRYLLILIAEIEMALEGTDHENLVRDCTAELSSPALVRAVRGRK